MLIGDGYLQSFGRNNRRKIMAYNYPRTRGTAGLGIQSVPDLDINRTYGDFIPPGGGINPLSSQTPVYGPPASAASAVVPTVAKGGALAALSTIAPIVGAGVSVIEMVSNIFAQDDYNEQVEENRKLAERMYRQQRMDEQAVIAENTRRWEVGRQDVEYAKQKGEEAVAYSKKRDRQADEWAVKQDRYAKYLQFTSNFNNYLNSAQLDRLQYIKGWAAM